MKLDPELDLKLDLVQNLDLDLDLRRTYLMQSNFHY